MRQQRKEYTGEVKGKDKNVVVSESKNQKTDNTGTRGGENRTAGVTKKTGARLVQTTGGGGEKKKGPKGSP